VNEFSRVIPFGFSHPAWLFLLLLVPLFYWMERRSLVLLGKTRKTLSLIIRCAIILLLVLALSGFRVERPSDRLSVVFAIDRSESIPESETNRALHMINSAAAQKRAKDKAGLIVFADEALVERPPAEALRVDALESAPPRGYTDISRAIRLATGLFPEGTQKRLVIFTDGNENLGNAITDANIAAANDITIDLVPLSSSTGDEVLVESVSVPDKVDKNKPFDVKITVKSSYAGEAKLRLYKDKNFIGENSVQLTEGKNIFLFPQLEDQAGFHTYEAMIDTLQDTVRDNNQAGAYTVIYGEPKVLLTGDPEDTQMLQEALKLNNIPADVAELPPSSAADIENYDAVFLCNVPAQNLSDEQLKLLRTYCGELGGGLAMTGGENSFGLGGYHNTPVEEAMPVSMEIKNKKNFPSLGLIILIDKSGSMSGSVSGSKSKLELAAEAAVASEKLLTERDYIGVIGFDSAAKWDCPFQLAKNHDEIESNIRSLRPGGGTDALPAFKEALKAFTDAKLQLKHIIFISDGMVMPGDYDRVIGQLNKEKVTISTIGVGLDTDREFMQKVANSTNGRFYVTNDPNSVPRIFTRETILAQRSYLIEESFTPKFYQQSEITKGISALPPLLGYVATEDKDRAEVLLKSHKDDAILATWHYRSGKALAWTSDVRDRWAANWVSWPDFKKFWGQATRWVMRNRKQGDLHPVVTVENGVGHITVDAVNDKGEFRNFLNLETSVITPEIETRNIRLKQTAAGHYEAEFDAKQVGTYIASVSGQNVDSAVAGANVSYPPEYQSLHSNVLLMSEVAAITGGKINSAPREWFRPGKQRVQSIQEPWYHLLWLALLLFILDIGVRRIFLDEEQRQQIAEFLRKLIPQVPVRRTAEATAGTLGALKATRARVRREIEPQTDKAVDLSAKIRNLEAVVDEAQKKPGVVSGKPAEGAKKPDIAESQSDKEKPRQQEEVTYTSRILEARRKAQQRKSPKE
jgi:uncharacterized membrane protein/Mg-chelatase subunit ChlD